LENNRYNLHSPCHASAMWERNGTWRWSQGGGQLSGYWIANAYVGLQMLQWGGKAWAFQLRQASRGQQYLENKNGFVLMLWSEDSVRDEMQNPVVTCPIKKTINTELFIDRKGNILWWDHKMRTKERGVNHGWSADQVYFMQRGDVEMKNKLQLVSKRL